MNMTFAFKLLYYSVTYYPALKLLLFINVKRLYFYLIKTLICVCQFVLMYY